nr:hypothetical protein [Tanacetum cinerariifolium]
MARQCTQPKRPSNASRYTKKAMLAEAHEARQILDEGQLAFLVDPRIPVGQGVQTIIPNNVAFQNEDLDTYDSDCDDILNAKAVLMAIISNYGSDVISEVPNSETYLNDMENQSGHAMRDFEQPPAMDFIDNEIHSDSNIIIKPFDALLVKIKAPKELPKISLVNESLKKLKFHLAKFDNVVKIRTTPNARTEGIPTASSNWQNNFPLPVKKDGTARRKEYHQFASELPIERRIEMITDLVKDFRGMTFEEVEAEFNSIWKQMEDFIPMGSKEEAKKIKRKGLNLEKESAKKQKTSEEVPEETMSPEEVPEEKVKEMMQLVPIEEVCVEALQVKHPIINWKVYTEGQRRQRNLHASGEGLPSKEGSSTCDDQLQASSGELLTDGNDLILKIYKITNSPRQQGMFKLDLEHLAPTLLQNREIHLEYLKNTQEQADILQGIVKQAKSEQPLDNVLDSALQKRLMSNPKTRSRKLGLKCSTSNCESKPTSNKKNDSISQPPSKNIKNKVEGNSRNVNKKNRFVKPIYNVDVKQSQLNANSKLICATSVLNLLRNIKNKIFRNLWVMYSLKYVLSGNQQLVDERLLLPPKQTPPEVDKKSCTSLLLDLLAQKGYTDERDDIINIVALRKYFSLDTYFNPLKSKP